MSDYLSSCLRPLFITFISGPYRHIPRLRDRASKPGESQHYGFVRAGALSLLPGPAGPSDHMGGSKIRSRTRGGLHFGGVRSSYSVSYSRRPGMKWRISMMVVLVIAGVLSGLIIRKEWGIENEIVRAEQMGFMNYQVSSVIRISQENRALAEGSLQDTILRSQRSWRRILTLRKQRTSRTTTVSPKAKI